MVLADRLVDPGYRHDVGPVLQGRNVTTSETQIERAENETMIVVKEAYAPTHHLDRGDMTMKQEDLWMIGIVAFLHPFHRILRMGPLGIDPRVLSQNKNIRPEECPFFRPDALR